ncbi:MAG: PhoH family protein [Eubacteriaceae bacterium]|nr:PhoH family protein [Eubacteriaceae bacterium]
MEKHEETVQLPQNLNQIALFGANDEHAKVVEGHFGVSIVLRNNALRLIGPEEGSVAAKQAIEAMVGYMLEGHALDSQVVLYFCDLYKSGFTGDASFFISHVTRNAKGRSIKTKTIGQYNYIKAIGKNEVTFSIGPAGTGKTYLAIACAIDAFRRGEISRIILVRPAVEAGEHLGFLPGDLKDKIDPYLRPMYDAMFDIMGPEPFERSIAKGAVEIAPLAYMRGRTLDNAFIILDEAQNTTVEQMKMFLTRLGIGSKAVVTGDVTQIDFPFGKASGLIHVQSILRGIQGIEFIYLDRSDVVRSSLVQRIISAYEKSEALSQMDKQGGL